MMSANNSIDVKIHQKQTKRTTSVFGAGDDLDVFDVGAIKSTITGVRNENK